jgi:hypothetical protein
MLSVILTHFVMLNIAILRDIMPSVIIPNAAMVSFVAPFLKVECQGFLDFELEGSYCLLMSFLQGTLTEGKAQYN